MAWSTSTRKGSLPPDWPRRVAATRARAHGRCEHVGPDGRCPAQGVDCDHAGHRHDHDTLQWLCATHHQAKTQAEATRARWRYRDRRDPEPHPGLT